jgi:adenine phosphoribosyltransferase
LTVKCAEALIPLLPEHDIMLTAEAKSIPLIHELAKQQGENEYIIARKGEKVYMPSPMSALSRRKEFRLSISARTKRKR